MDDERFRPQDEPTPRSTYPVEDDDEFGGDVELTPRSTWAVDDDLAPDSYNEDALTPRSTSAIDDDDIYSTPRSTASVYDDDLFSSTPDDSSERSSRARDRQRRRREQREQMVRPSSARSVTPQIRRTTGLRMPTIRIPRNTRLIVAVVAGLALIPIMLVMFQALKGDPPISEPNAIWIGTEWTYERHEDADVAELVARLKANRIGTVYAWVSWLQEDETWRGTDNFENVQAFVAQFKRLYPEAELYGWVSLPVDTDDDRYRLDEETIRTSVATFSQGVVDNMGFDGVFLNIEPVWDGDENFLDLLRKVRGLIGEDTPIAVAIPPDWSPTNATIPVPPLITPGTEWSLEYKQSVALLSDQLAVMAYNSGLSSAADYELWVAYQVQTYAEAVNELNIGTEVIVGIPTYAAELPAHDPDVENVESALRGVRIGILQSEDAGSTVAGVAIYAGWETDETEWAQFKTHWVDGGT